MSERFVFNTEEQVDLYDREQSQYEEHYNDEEAYRELIELLLPGGKCPKFQTCTQPDKDDYYCHDFCPWIPSFETWIEELEEMRKR